MKAAVSRPLVALVLAAALLGVVASGMASAGAQSTAAGPAQACARVDVLLLIDQSASLRKTDPQDQRVAAAEVLLRSLADTAAASGTSVDVTVAAFGTDTVEVGRASLPSGVGGAVDIVRPFASRQTDLNTDYVLALSFAVRHFQAVTDLPSDCKRLVWFTDGAYSIDDLNAPGLASYTSTTDRATVVGELEGQICGALPATSRLSAPMSQQIRQAGFVVQLVDLRSDAIESEAERADREATAPVINRLLSGDANDGCTVPGGRVEAGHAEELASEFFVQGQIALGRVPVACTDLAAGYPAALVRAVTVRGASADQSLAVTSGGQVLAQGAGFVTWVLPAKGGGARGPTVAAGAADGSAVDGCYADLSASVVPVGSERPDSSSTTMSWAVLGAGVDPAGAADPAARLGPDAVSVAAVIDGRQATVTWDGPSRTWQVIVLGPADALPVVVMTASAPGFGQLATTSSALAEGASLAPPRVGWGGATRLEGAGSFGGRLGVVPAPVPAGAPIPDGVVCVEFGEPVTSTDAAHVTLAEKKACHPAGEPFAVAASVVVDRAQNATLQVAVPYTVTHRAVGSSQDQIVAVGQAEMPSLVLTKPVDPVKGALYTLAIVLLSALLPLALLVWLINRHRRLPAPSTRRMARVALLSHGGELLRPADSTITAADLQPIPGTRKRYDLPGGLRLVRPRTFNPFAPTIVEAHSTIGTVAAVPWMAPGAGRSVQVPAGFIDLVLIRSEAGVIAAEAVVIVPAGASAEEADHLVDQAIASTNRLWVHVHSAMSLLQI